MTSCKKNKRIRIAKFKDTEKYRPQAIYVQATRESLNIWNIVAGTKLVPSAPSSSATKANQATYTLTVYQYITIKDILILRVELLILIDKCTTSLAKEIWKYYSV